MCGRFTGLPGSRNKTRQTATKTSPEIAQSHFGGVPGKNRVPGGRIRGVFFGVGFPWYNAHSWR